MTLVIKWHDSLDDGTRPIPGCGDATHPYWTNSSIQLATPPDGPSPDPGTAAANKQNKINVVVWNKSTTTAENVTVDGYVCDFTAGFGPTFNRPSAGGIQTLLTQNVGQIAAGGVHTFQLLWTPDDSDTTVNGGHVCIAANVYANGEGIPIPPDFFITPTDHVNTFCTDAHHAQKNIMVRAVKGGQKNLDVQMFVGNPDPENGHTMGINLHQTRGRTLAELRNERFQLVNGPFARPKLLETAEMRRLTSTRAERLGVGARLPHTLRPVPRQLFLADDSAVRVHLSRYRVPDLAFEGDNIPRGNVARVPLESGQQKLVNVTASFTGREVVGSVHVFDLTQTAENGQSFGGARILALIVP